MHTNEVKCATKGEHIRARTIGNDDRSNGSQVLVMATRSTAMF